MTDDMFTRLTELLAIDLHALPEATHEDIGRRTQDEVHACVRCGGSAQVAFLLASKTLTRRWVDLCPGCAYRVRQWASDEGRDRGVI